MASAHEQALRAAYEAETLDQCRTGARGACCLAFLFVPVFALEDVVAGRAFAPGWLLPRLLCLGGVGIALWLLRTPVGARHPRGIALLVAGLMGFLVDWATLESGGGSSPRYAGLTLISLAGCLMMPWERGGVIAGSIILCGGYVATVSLFGRIGDPEIFANHLTYLIGTCGICLMAAHLREQLRWTEFTSRVALADALRLQGEFTAKMSHEIRTPINVMIGYADILLDGALEHASAERRQLVEKVRSHGVKLRMLVSDLLDYAKAGAGRLSVRPERVAARDVVEEIADSFRPIAERKGVRVMTEGTAAPVDVLTDRQRLAQILMNLVANAVKFTEQGTVTLVIRALGPSERALADGRTLAGDDAAPTDGVAILVRDTGIGIRPDDLARLADDYIQLDGGRHGGTGLGLSIARKLTQLLGGRLAVTSRPGEGTTFAVVLPRATALRQAA